MEIIQILISVFILHHVSGHAANIDLARDICQSTCRHSYPGFRLVHCHEVCSLFELLTVCNLALVTGCLFDEARNVQLEGAPPSNRGQSGQLWISSGNYPN